MTREDDDGYEDDEVEANDSATQVVLEDDWTYLRYGDIILFIIWFFFFCKRYYKIDIFVAFLNDECDFINCWN